MRTLNGKKKLNNVETGLDEHFEVIDSYESPKVRLMNHNINDDMVKTLAEFILCSFGRGDQSDKIEHFFPTNEQMMEIIECSFKGEALPLAMELPVFTFCISGIDRVTTHQIVRSRVGVVFSQHCTGDNDLRNANFLLPTPIMELNKTNISLFNKTLDTLQSLREIYSEMVDKNNISIQDARHIFPHCQETYLMMNCNFMMLKGYFSRRACANETFQMQRVARLMKEQIEEINHPLSSLIAKHLKSGCEARGKCHRSVNSIFSGSVFHPCGKYPHGEILDKEMYIHDGPPRKFRKVQGDFEGED